MSKPLTLIAAMAPNRVIGSGAGMPWNVPEEYAQFRNLIAGQTVIMGRRSWEIFGADLTSSHNIIVSRTAKHIEGATVIDGVEPAIEAARGFGKTVFSAGGAQIYRQTLPYAGRLYLSTIKGQFEGDAYFPDFDESAWSLTREEDHPGFVFRVWERRS